MARIPVGFIGLGNMGKPLARNLVGEAFALCVHDVDAAAVAELAALGARAAASTAELARASRFIGLCVRDDRDVDSLLYGADGIFAHAAAGTVILIHSTVTQAGLLRWAADAAQAGIELLDAPVTRGRLGQEPKFVCFMVGGEAALLERCRPVLEPSAEAIVHAGPLGAGTALKLCNNLITYLEFIAMSEAAALAARCGLDVAVLGEVGRANGVINERMLAFVQNRAKLKASLDPAGFERAFGSFGRLGEKDLDCALDSAAALGLELPATQLARERIHATFLDRA